MKMPRNRWVLTFAIAVVLGAGVAATVFWRNQSVPESYRSHRSEFLQMAKTLSAGSNTWFGSRQIDDVRRQINHPEVQPAQAFNLYASLSFHLLRLGHTDEGVREIEAGYALAARHGLTIPGDMHAWRAVAYLRQAEVNNCIQRHNRDCCIFPLQGGGVHSVKESARQATRHYLAYVESRPNDLGGHWLLNILAMALGEYPEGIPEQYRIPPSAFESEYDIGRFTDIAPALGVDTFNLCGGAMAEDFDNDGWLDLVTSTGDPAGPIVFYRNLGNGQFQDDSASSRLNDQLGGLNCLAADYDNDGDMDILVLRGAWLFDDGLMRNSLLRKNSDGTFQDVTREAGLAEPAYPTQAAAWGDFDNDGDLDLYVGNESRMEIKNDLADFPSQLFINNGNGTFTDVAKTAGVTNDRYAKGVSAGDYDNDGDLDLYVSNVTRNRLYRNNGDGTFEDVAEQAGVVEPRGRSFATWFFDYNNNGWLDLFVAAFDCSIRDIAADYLGRPHTGVTPRLYRNDRNGRFSDVTRDVGLAHPYLPMGANFGDLDNDGYLDVYLTTGDPDFTTLMPNVMLRNNRGASFQNVTTSGGFGHLQKGHGVAFADFDHDGDQDIYNQLGGFYPGDKFRNTLYLNPGHGNRFLFIDLVGTTSNRRGVGARINLTVNTPNGQSTFHRAVGSVSSFGGSPLRQEIGLGDATAVKRVEVYWPTSNTRQVFTDIPLDTGIRITEGREKLDSIVLRSVRLGS